MTKFIVIASGKGGVGKTTTAINLGVALNNLGKDVIVLDGNLTTPNVGLYLGVHKVKTSIHDVIKDNKSVLEAIYRHTSGVKVIPGDISVDALSSLDSKKLKKAIQKLQGASEIVIIDSPGGLNKENLALLSMAEEALVVTTPDVVSVTDALKTIKLAEEKNVTVLGVLVNRIKGDKMELSEENIETMLNRPVLSSIPESDAVRRSHMEKHPVVFTDPNSDVSSQFKKLAANLVGSQYEDNLQKDKTGWFTNLLQKMRLR